MSFLNLPVRTLVAACGLSLLSLAAHADSFRGDAHAPQQAAVATPHPAATVAGLETLANGGNAFDAAAAIAAALAVAEPYGSGLGGGGFFLLRQAGAQPTYRFLDARERAPKAAYADMYRRNGKVDPRLSVDGPLAAAIPGLPAALVELSGRYGRKPWPTTWCRRSAWRWMAYPSTGSTVTAPPCAWKRCARTRKPRGSSSTRAQSPTNGTCSANRSWHVPWNASGATGGSASTKARQRTSCSPGSAPAAASGARPTCATTG